MTAKKIISPFEVMIDLEGNPLENGYVYIGEANKNPEVYPVSIYWDSSMTTPAANPVRTINGYLSKNGSPGKLYVGSDYSITIRDKNKALIFSSFSESDTEVDNGVSFSATGTTGGATVKTISLSSNSGEIIEIYGSGLKNSLICIKRSVFSIWRTTGAMTITEIMSEDISDGDNTGGYFGIVQSGNNAIIKAYTDANTWAVTGSIKALTGGTITIS